MANVIRKVISTLDASSRPAGARAKHAPTSGQVAPENAPAGNVGAPAATLVAPAAAPFTPDAPPVIERVFECHWCQGDLAKTHSQLFSKGHWYCDFTCANEQSTYAPHPNEPSATALERAKAIVGEKRATEAKELPNHIEGWNMDFISWSNHHVQVPKVFANHPRDVVLRDLAVVKLLAVLYAWDSQHKLFYQMTLQQTPMRPAMFPVARIAYTCASCWHLPEQCECEVVPVGGIVGGE